MDVINICTWFVIGFLMGFHVIANIASVWRTLRKFFKIFCHVRQSYHKKIGRFVQFWTHPYLYQQRSQKTLLQLFTMLWLYHNRCLSIHLEWCLLCIMLFFWSSFFKLFCGLSVASLFFLHTIMAFNKKRVFSTSALYAVDMPNHVTLLRHFFQKVICCFTSSCELLLYRGLIWFFQYYLDRLLL